MLSRLAPLREAAREPGRVTSGTPIHSSSQLASPALTGKLSSAMSMSWARTAWRPTAKGELSTRQALLFSAVLCSLGSVLLYWWVNPLTMWLTFATFVGYAVIYTVVLKPMTPQNIVIGHLNHLPVTHVLPALADVIRTRKLRTVTLDDVFLQPEIPFRAS